MNKKDLQKLAFLLYTCPLSKDVKEAWLKLLPSMNFNQLKALMLMLDSYRIEEDLLDQSFKRMELRHDVQLDKIIGDI